jgi:hypothetical protein
MGNKKFNLTKLALAMGVTLGLSGCFSDNDNNIDFKPPEPEPPVVIDVPVNDSPEALSFFVKASIVDATAENLTVVPNATVKFFENGVASTNITDIDGNEVAELPAANGTLSFNVKEDAEITSVTVMVTAEGYFDKTAVVEFGEKDAVVDTLITLAKTDTLVVKEETASAAGGKLAEDLTSKTADESVTVAISADIELQDANGEAVTGEEITLSVVTAPLEAEEGKASAVDVIPQGFAEVASDDAATIAEPAGYVEVTMSAGDTPIKNFDAPITITTTVNGDYAEGDKFAITSFDEDTGVWTKEENEATLGAGNVMAFPATFETDHLTGFLLTRSRAVCDTAVSYNLTGDAVPSAGLFMVLESSTLFQVYAINEASGTLISQADLKKFGIAKDATVDADIFDANGNVYAESASVNLCGEISLPLTAPAVTVVDESLPMSFSCSNADVDDQLSLGGAVVTYAQAGKVPQVATESPAGTYALNGLISGQEYTVTVNTRIEGFNVESFTITADGTAEAQSFERSNCQTEEKEVTGTGGQG